MTRIHQLFAATVAMIAIGGVSLPAERDLLLLSGAVVGDSLPPRWQKRVVRGSRTPLSTIRNDGGERFLSISGQGQAAWFALDLRNQSLSREGVATLAYRMTVVPKGSDLAIAERSDAALRFYVAFEGTRRFLSNPRLLFYSLGTLSNGPRVLRSGTLCDIRLARTSSTAWQQLVVTPAADAARECGWTDGRIVGVGVMQDTDQTGSPAAADLRALIWTD